MGSGRTVDVAILGGGMAGGLLARQLTRALPGLRIALFEKSHERGFRVGESMVEIASHYFIRRLGLSSYLYDRQLPKNGLRFFFDRSDCSAALPEMSEIGSESLPFMPAFQIDRARLDTDLLEQAVRAGVEVRMGARLERLELGEGGAQHRLTVQYDAGSTETCQARWVVDASGRTRLIARQRGLAAPEASHRISAAWGRFEGVADVDELGPPAFRERVRYTARRLSTLHFLYPGYWIWFIPLPEGITSVGVVGEPSIIDRCRSAPELVAFLGGHRAIRSLLEPARVVDFLRYRNLSYGTSQFLSRDRWGLTGEAAVFADPLYSPGTDFIALENDFLTDLVERDLSGAGDQLDERAALYDEFLRFRHEAAMRLYRGLYPLLGSFSLAKLKWDLDIGSYYNLWVSSYLTDQHLDPDYLRRQLEHRPYVLQALANFADLFRKAEGELSAQGRYHERNLGAYSDGRDCLGFITELGQPRTQKQSLVEAQRIFNKVRHDALDLLEGPAPGGRDPKPLSFFMRPQPLV